MSSSRVTSCRSTSAAAAPASIRLSELIDTIAGRGQGHRVHQLARAIESGPSRLPFADVPGRIAQCLVVEQLGLSENQVDAGQPGLSFLHEQRRPRRHKQ